MTNFERVAASPEALAEWLDEHFSYCQQIQHYQCDKCPYDRTYCPDENAIWLDWLKR